MAELRKTLCELLKNIIYIRGMLCLLSHKIQLAIVERINDYYRSLQLSKFMRVQPIWASYQPHCPSRLVDASTSESHASQKIWYRFSTLLFMSVWPRWLLAGSGARPCPAVPVVRRAPVCHYFGFVWTSALLVMIVPTQVEDFVQALTRQSANVFPCHSF